MFIVRGDVKLFALAYPLAQFVGLADILGGTGGLAEVAVAGSQPRVGHGKVGIQADGPLEQRNGSSSHRFSLSSPGSPGCRLAVPRAMVWSRSPLARHTSAPRPAIRPASRAFSSPPRPAPSAPAPCRWPSACSFASTSPLRQFTAFSPSTYWLPRLEIEPSMRGGAGGALADLAGQLAGEPRIFGLGHQRQRLRHALVRKQVQKRRLLQLRRQPLPQRAVEDRIAGGVGEVGEDDGVLLGQAVRGLARAEVERPAIAAATVPRRREPESSRVSCPLQELRRPSPRSMTEMEQRRGGTGCWRLAAAAT